MLMLSQRLMLMLTMDTTDTDSDHTDTMDTELDTMDIHTDTDTGERSNFYCQNALNQIQTIRILWIQSWILWISIQIRILGKEVIFTA